VKFIFMEAVISAQHSLHGVDPVSSLPAALTLLLSSVSSHTRTFIACSSMTDLSIGQLSFLAVPSPIYFVVFLPKNAYTFSFSPRS
jgi:hypothetical protein